MTYYKRTFPGQEVVTAVHSTVMDCVNNSAHHWLLDEVDGQTFVSGVCKKCGKTRDNFRCGEQIWNFEEVGHGRPITVTIDGFVEATRIRS